MLQIEIVKIQEKNKAMKTVKKSLNNVSNAIKNTVNIASSATSTITFTWWWVFVLILLLIGIWITLVSVVKWAQITWKKTKIINIVDEEHNQMESTKDEIKKWLFNDEEMNS